MRNLNFFEDSVLIVWETLWEMFGITARWLLGWCTGYLSKKYQQVASKILVKVVAAEDS